MNTNELNFAYKVRRALNENLDNLPPSTAERLVSARKIALSRKKSTSGMRMFAYSSKLAGYAGSFFSEPLSWASRIAIAIPAIALIAGLIGIYEFEKQERIRDIAEIDALVLADELPLSAYLDDGFNAYLAKRGK